MSLETGAPSEGTVKHDQNLYGIDVGRFIERYHVEDPKVKEAINDFPTLCFLLGNVTKTVQGRDSRPDGVERDVFYLTEGSGMFGLKNPEDAMRWRGIFNHIVGSSKHTYYLSQRMSALTDGQRQQFLDLGFDINSLGDVDPVFLRDFMFVNHASRRLVDERKWHELTDTAHPKGENEPLTTNLLISEGAPQRLVDLMRVEDHEYLTAGETKGRFLNLAINILTYSDFTFGQKPNTLQERFEGLRKSQRQPDDILNKLEKAANYFEKALRQAFGPNIFEEMTKAGPYKWETQIREAYCSPYGLTISQVFPNYKPAV